MEWKKEGFIFFSLSPSFSKAPNCCFFVHCSPFVLLPHPCRESAILSQRLDECQARAGVVRLCYVKTCLCVCFATKCGSVSLQQSRWWLTWLRFVGTALTRFVPPELSGCRFHIWSLFLSLLYFFLCHLSFNLTYNRFYLSLFKQRWCCLFWVLTQTEENLRVKGILYIFCRLWSMSRLHFMSGYNHSKHYVILHSILNVIQCWSAACFCTSI